MTMNKETKLHFLQDYSVAEIHRSQINEAPYNPRQMPERHFKDLKRSLKKIKLRETLVWNKQTGNLVSGHQRLRVLDEEWQRKYDNLDYSITCTVIDVSQKEEIELNIAFNNPRLMGDYDISKMNEILSSEDMPDLDFDIAGIKDEDLQMFGVSLDIENLQNEDVESVIAGFEEIKEQKKKEIPPEEKERRKESVKQTKQAVTKNEVDTYVTISFSNQKDKRAFMEQIGEPEANLYIKGEIFVKKFFSE